MNGVTPNKAMRARHDLMRETGCIVCRIYEGVNTPPQIHHISGCKTQADHANTLALCYAHHMADQNHPQNDAYTSRHPHSISFEDRYATEADLLIEQNKVLGIK